MRSIGFMVGHPHFIPHAQALVHTIRTYGGSLAKHAIYILVPSEFETKIDIPDVNILEFSTPSNLQNIPFADKITAAKTLEQHLQGEGLTWMDVDSLVLRSPNKLNFSPEIKIAFKPVDKRNIGIPYHKEYDLFWQTIITHFNFIPKKVIHLTTASHEKIHPYINAGFIVAQQPEAVFSKTLTAMQQLIEEPYIKEKIETSVLHKIFFHQAVLTIAILKNFPASARCHLPETINYPLHFHRELEQDLNEVQTLRYDTFFNEDQSIPSPIQNILDFEIEDLKMIWYYN